MTRLFGARLAGELGLGLDAEPATRAEALEVRLQLGLEGVVPRGGLRLIGEERHELRVPVDPADVVRAAGGEEARDVFAVEQRRGAV